MNILQTIQRASWHCLTVVVSLTLGVFTLSADSFQPVTRTDPFFAPSITGGGDSGLPIVSGDGRYVLFASTAGNLTLTSNQNSLPVLFPAPLNVFLRDRANGTTSLVSINNLGVGGGNGDSVPKAISTNGQFVLFESSANNLVLNDTNNTADIFVRDLVNQVTLLVSVNTNGIAGNAVSRSAVMTPDGRYVAFTSAASDLVNRDTNGIADVFVRDLVAGSTKQVSVGAVAKSAALAPSTSSESPAITPDGRYVVFFSTATNLVAGVATTGEIYARDLQAGVSKWVSAGARSNFLSAVGTTNVVSCNYEMSADGKYIGYEACTNSPGVNGIILRYNLQTGFTDLVYTNANVPLTGFEYIRTLAMTPDGRFIAFLANVGGLTGTNTAIYVWDGQNATNTLVSANINNASSPNALCAAPVISTNGQFVTFLSSATDLVTNPLAGAYHIYQRDTMAGITQLVDEDLNGAGSGVNYASVPSLSADGSLVGFDSTGENLITNDFNHADDVFLRDLTKQTTELVSIRDPGLGSLTPNGSSGLFQYSVSTGGRWLAFASEADNLVTNDANGLRDVFVRDLLTGLNVLVSADTNGRAGAGMSTEPAISGDGRYVAFSSYATNLVASDINNAEDVFVRDLQSGVNLPVSLGNAQVPAHYDSFLPSISADGRYVLFHALSQQPVTGPENILLCDRQLNRTYTLSANNTYAPGVVSASMTPDGRYVAFTGKVGGNGPNLYVWDAQAAALIYTNSAGAISNLSISVNGQRVAYLAGSLYVADLPSKSNWLVSAGPFILHNGPQFSGDGNFLTYATRAATVAADKNGTNDVYLYHISTASNLLVSQSYNSNSAAKGPSDSPAISADGRFIIYRSAATNLVAGVTNGMAQLFVYDQWTGLNSLLTQNHSGGAPGNSHSRTPIFSGDGRTVVFQSQASDLNGSGDFNGVADLFAYSFFYLQVAGGSSTAGPTLSWPAAPGQTYQVQYKDQLSDANWQTVAGTVVINGNQAYLTNTDAVVNQRFYRIVAE